MSLKIRTATGIVFGAVMISGCLWSPLSCALLFLVVNIVCIWELSGHLLTQDGTVLMNVVRRGTALVIGSFLPILATIVWLLDTASWSWVVLLFPFMMSLVFLLELFGKSLKPFHNVAFISLGVFYISIPTTILVWLCSNPIQAMGNSGHYFILAMLFMVWASDVFAYLLGSKIGKNKMFPRISPKKTWEGTFSGVLGALLTGYGCSILFVDLALPIPFWIGAAFICTFFGILGDLVESMFKRSLGIKDSGTILPGHGGFLDRFDAFIFVVPFMYTYLLMYFQVW